MKDTEMTNEKHQLTSNQIIELIFMPILLIGGCGGAIVLAERLIPKQAEELVLWPIIIGLLIGVIPTLPALKILANRPVADVELVIRGSIYATAGLGTGIGIFVMNKILDIELLLTLLGLSLGLFSAFVSIISGMTLVRTYKVEWFKNKEKRKES